LRTHTEGVGLGLFMAKGIIQHHDGIVGVDSDGPDKGSSFWFIIPEEKILKK
jgi:signal transduction histidine kinase